MTHNTSSPRLDVIKFGMHSHFVQLKIEEVCNQPPKYNIQYENNPYLYYIVQASMPYCMSNKRIVSTPKHNRAVALARSRSRFYAANLLFNDTTKLVYIIFDSILRYEV